MAMPPAPPGLTPPVISSPLVNDTVPLTFTAIGTFVDVAGSTEIWCKLDAGAKSKATINSPRAGVWKCTLTTTAGSHKLVVERFVSGVSDGSAETDPFTAADPPAVTLTNLNQGDTKPNGFAVTGGVSGGRMVSTALVPLDSTVMETPQAVSVGGATWDSSLGAAKAGIFEYVVRAAAMLDPTDVVVTRVGQLEIT